MAGLVVTIGGTLDTSYGYALERSVIDAKAAAAAMTGEFSKIEGANMIDAAIASVNARRIRNAGAGQLWKEDSLATAAMLAGFEKQRIAAIETSKVVRASQLAMLTTVATTGAASAFGGTSHGGGISGIIRESLVIIREISMGRGMGRIAGSVSLLAQYLGVLKLAIKSTATESILAAAAQDEVARATARQALMIDASTARTIESGVATEADIAILQAQTTAIRENAIAQALRAKEMNLAKDVQVGGAITKLNPAFFITIGAVTAALVALFVAYKFVTDIIKDKNEVEKQSEELTLENTLSIGEEIDVLNKLADAMRKTDSALASLNETKSDFLERSNEAIDALKAEAEAQSNLNDAKTSGQLLDVDIAEKHGKISQVNAIFKKAEIQADAVADKAQAKQDALDQEASLRQQQADVAQTLSAKAQQAARDKSAELNENPEEMQKASDLAEAQKQLQQIEKHAADLRKQAADTDIYGINPLVNDQNRESKANDLKSAAESDEAAKALAQEIEIMKGQMNPSQISEAKKLQEAQEAKNTEIELQKDARKAKTAADDYRKNSPDLVLEEQKNILKQAGLSALGNQPKPENLNAMQKLGAFTAQGNNPLIDLHKTTNQRLQQILDVQKSWTAHIKNQQGQVRH